MDSIQALVSIFGTAIAKALSDIKDDVMFYFNQRIPEYLASIESKFSNTKTFLYRTETVNFYDVYFEISLKNKKCNNYIVKDIESLFKQTNFISIIGNAGSGKSMLLKHIFLSSIKQTLKIPIVIELRHLNDFSGNFIEYLNSLLCGKNRIPNTKILERILSEGNFLFLIDGYDEIYSKNKEKITSDIINFIDNYNKNYFLITSRPSAGLEIIPRLDNYYVNQLSDKQIEEFTRKQLKLMDDTKLADKIIAVINKSDNKSYHAYLSSPLLLSMFIITFKSYPELPTSRAKFYWNIFDTLCNKHDSFTKHGGYQHERKSNLENENIEKILKWFAYKSFFAGKYSFDEQYLKETLTIIRDKLSISCDIEKLIYDLVVSISIIMQEGSEYKFPHRSLQEYFTAILIKDQSDVDKQKFYNDLSIKPIILGNFGFLKLCYEIDNKNFNKFFVLPNLRKIIENFNIDDDEIICKKFLEKLKFCHIFRQPDYSCNTSQYHPSLSFFLIDLFQPKDEVSTLLHFAPIKNSNTLKEPRMKNIIQNIGIKLDETQTLVDYSKNWNKQVYEFVKLIGIESIILEVIDKIKHTIPELETQIAIQESNESDLLNL